MAADEEKCGRQEMGSAIQIQNLVRVEQEGTTKASNERSKTVEYPPIAIEGNGDWKRVSPSGEEVEISTVY